MPTARPELFNVCTNSGFAPALRLILDLQGEPDNRKH